MTTTPTPNRTSHRLPTRTSAERSADKLTVDDICADLGIARRTFYEWRAKQRAPKCIRLPNGDLRIRRSEYQRWLDSREDAA